MCSKTEKTMKISNRRNLYLITICVSIAFVALGVTSAWATPVLPKFTNNETQVIISKNEVAVMFSMYPIGFAFGSLITRYTADMMGRRTTILCSALPITLGSLILVFATKAWLLYITAFNWQFGTGMLSTVIGYYLSEIADKDIRATLQVITSFSFKLGNLLTMVLGPFLAYNTLNYIILVLPIIYFSLCSWIPETPYFCLKAGNIEGARRSLKVLRRYKDESNLETELMALEADVKNEMKHSSTLKELFTGVQYRRAVIIAAGLKMTLILTGGALIRQYLGWIMAETKLDMKLPTVFIIYGCVNFGVGLVSSVLVDRVGRRPLLIYSYFGTGLSLGVVALYFFLQDVVGVSSSTLSTYSLIPFICIILSNIISTLGYNSLIFIIPAEIFPLNVKAIAMTSLNIFGSLLAFSVAQGYQHVKDASGLTTIFSIFAVFAIGGGIFSIYVVTETKGKNLRDIQVELQGNLYKAVEINEKADSLLADENVELKDLKVDEK